MVQCTRIFAGGNEMNNKATQLTIAGLWAEISNMKLVQAANLTERVCQCGWLEKFLVVR
jgi:aerobic-type carbon monoxide dehydrogenase small subunit (CoxS/CutS family)